MTAPAPTACSDADFPLSERFENDGQGLIDRPSVSRESMGGGLIIENDGQGLIDRRERIARIYRGVASYGEMAKGSRGHYTVTRRPLMTRTTLSEVVLSAVASKVRLKSVGRTGARQIRDERRTTRWREQCTSKPTNHRWDYKSIARTIPAGGWRPSANLL
jgi:hypothetical protein